MADIKYIVTVDSAGAVKNIQNLDGTIKGLGTTINRDAKPALSGLWKQFTIGTLAADAARKAINFVKTSISDSVKAAIEAETADNNLRLALDSTGKSAKNLAPHFKAYAEQLMDITIYDDEVIKGAQALLIQMGLSTKQTDEATRGAIGLATTYKIDLSTAARIVGKAIEGDIDALARYIPKLKNATSNADKARIVHEEFAKMFERAKGEMNTFGGRLTDLSKNWNELKESIGRTVTENKGVSDFIFVLTRAVKGLREEAEKISGAKGKGLKIWDMFLPLGNFKIISAGFTDIAERIREAEKPLHTIPEYASAWKVFLSVFENKIPGITKFFGKLGTAVDDSGDSFIKTKTKIEIAATDISKVISKHWRDVLVAMIAIWKEGGPAFFEYERAVTEVAQITQYRTNIITAAWLGASRTIGGAATALAKTLWNSKEDIMIFANEIARAMLSLRGIMIAPFKFLEEGATKTTKTVNKYFDGLYNDIAQGFANTIQSWLEGAKTFEDFMLGLWDNIKTAFFRMIGEMVAEWVLKKFMDLFSKIAGGAVSAMSSAAGSAVKAVSGITSGAAGAIGGLWTGLGAAVGSFLGTALAGGGFPDSVGNWIHETRNKAFEIDQKMYWAVANLDSIKRTLWTYQKPMVAYLKAIASHTAMLKNIQMGQHGLDTVVNKPTLFLAGERGAERVSITPRRTSEQAGQLEAHIYIGGEKIETQVVKIVNRSIGLKRIKAYA